MAVAVAPKLVGERHSDLGAGGKRFFPDCVHVWYVKVKMHRKIALDEGRHVELGREIVGKHEVRIADAHMDVHQFAARSGRPLQFDGAESALQKVAERRRAIDIQMRSHRVKSGWNGIGRFRHRASLSERAVPGGRGKIEAGRPMDRPAATAREIILEIVRNMREGLEPLHYSTLPPSVYNVYLHPDDLERLRGILPRLVQEARRALDAEVESLNRTPLAERIKLARRSLPKVETPEGGWQIQFLENTEDDAGPGDILIDSELGLPVKPDLGSGSMTKRIATRRLGSTGAEAPAVISQTGPSANFSGAYAVIEYQDNGGRQTYRMTKDQIVVGRGGRDYWTDLKLDTAPDVSREHFRLRRDPATGKFYLKDLSRLGTTINGQPAPSSVEFAEGEKRDRDLEAALPDSARIGLAGVLFLEFRSLPNG